MFHQEVTKYSESFPQEAKSFSCLCLLVIHVLSHLKNEINFKMRMYIFMSLYYEGLQCAKFVSIIVKYYKSEDYMLSYSTPDGSAV